MDVELIYCAEQIVVPPDLADILKAYTKEVIRRQPTDLVQFSAMYFANLANVTKDSELVPPSLEQLAQSFRDCEKQAKNGNIDFQVAVDICLERGVNSMTLDKVCTMVQSPQITPADLPIIMLTTTTDNFGALISGLFEVFGSGGVLPKDAFLDYFGQLTRHIDRDALNKKDEIAAVFAENDEITYALLMETENPLTPKLRVL